MKKPTTVSKRKTIKDRAVRRSLHYAFSFASRIPCVLVNDDIPLTDEDRAHLALMAQQYAR